jgi:hypothetical protein
MAGGEKWPVAICELPFGEGEVDNSTVTEFNSDRTWIDHLNIWKAAVFKMSNRDVLFWLDEI